MRDLHLRHTLKSLARDAAAVFTEIVEAGQEIPYEIAEPGDSFAFCQYLPLTAKFVRDNAAELRELESFHEATETMRKSDLAAAYLEEAGIAPPADPVERATLAVTYFLARLWDGCSDFEIDEDRFGAALEEVEECSDPEAGEVEAIVPLVGFQMPTARVELNGAAIVRADTVDVPAEAARSERRPGGEWEPTFVICARVDLGGDGGLGAAGEVVARTFDRVVTTLRLLKAGGVGLGPHGWVRVAGDRWRRIATGAGRPRPGGYRLGKDELPTLVDLARTMSLYPKRVGRLRRALLRFDGGLDRRGAVDALNDHLLGLRFLLEGEGPAGVGLPMRAAALAGEEPERTEIKRTVEQAIALERELWSGERPADASTAPAEIAVRIEDLLRTILRRAVSGELGADLRATADEALIADGIAAGDGAGEERGSTTEWDLEPERVEEVDSFERFEREAEPEIAVHAPRDDEAVTEIEIEPVAGAEQATVSTVAPADDAAEARAELPDWLGEVDAGSEETMDFPVGSNHLRDLARPPMDREEVRARVESLFPRTETEWTVGEGDSTDRAAGF